MYNYNDYITTDYFRNNDSNMITAPNISNQNKNLYSPTEGYDRGNMFIDLYSQYKDYKPVKLQANNEKEALFLELSRNAFASHEIKLYLDIFPKDETMISLFNDYENRKLALINEYEKRYGIDNNQYSSWPWEGGSK